MYGVGRIRRAYFTAGIISLGTAFLAGATLSGCNQGSMSDFDKKQQGRENAVAILTNCGAKITKLNQEDMHGWSVDLNQVPFDSKIAEQLKILDSPINVLNLSKTSIDDKQLVELIDQKVVGAVMELNLRHNPAITDQALDKIASLLNLYDLDLVGTQVTEIGIARLQEQRKPRQTSDRTLESIKSMPERMQKSARELLKKELKIRH